MPDGFFDAGQLADANGVIESYKSAKNQDLIRLWVPNSVKQIGAAAFKDCQRLEEIRFEDGGNLPLDVGMMVFEGCISLRSVVLPRRVKSLGRACFKNCAELHGFAIAEGGAEVFRMPLNVFDGCPGRDAMVETLQCEIDRRVAEQNRPKPPVLTREEVGEYVLYPAVKGDTQQQLPEGIPNGTLFVCVDKTWSVAKTDPTTNQRISLEDCARGYWCDTHLRKVRLGECRWLMAISKKKIAQVWKIDFNTGWRSPEEIAKPSWPSDRGPWLVPRSGCRFLPEDNEVLAVRDACKGKEVKLKFNESQTVRGVFLRLQ